MQDIEKMAAGNQYWFFDKARASGFGNASHSRTECCMVQSVFVEQRSLPVRSLSPGATTATAPVATPDRCVFGCASRVARA
jgi:hypothetical protein